MTKLRYLTKEGFRNLRVNRLMTLASITVLFSCLLLVGVAFVLLANIESFIGSIEAENVIMVYANTDITGYDYAKMGAEIDAMDYVAKVESVEKGPAYEQILSELDDSLRAYLESIDENPLPDAYRITVGDMDHFEDVVNQLKLLENVLRVHENSSLARQMSSLKNAVQYISLGIIALLLLVSLFIISNTIKVTMFSRRLEISIMKSVGATNSFIKWPFVVEGIVIGIIAGLLATGAVWGLYTLAMKELSYIVTSFVNIKLISFIDYAPYLAAVFVCIGIFAGVFGSITSIRKYLKERKFVEIDDI
ncbi:MAG: permease-like cell division protein FtsX [Clostridia bacterium]|nr:permease-like cell division protein FtsX [Clostridia bacterium]MBR5771735.1 permease-like cell division protein FtsX [Clostridia bacterium]